MKRILGWAGAMALVAGLGGCVSVASNTEGFLSPPPISDAGPDASAAELLRPYYTQLFAGTDLPAMSSPQLDASTALTRIAFGSCNHHDRSQDVWSSILAQNPQAMLMIGDNVYGDNGWRGEADLGSFLSAYRKQAAYPEFQALMRAQPVFATWDDHDYGPNDSGGEFVGKYGSEMLFETFWDASETARSRPGIYDSVMAGPAGQRVQIIMLDTRFFRSALAEMPYSEERRRLGNYAQNTNPAATVLGEAQWDWLTQELAKPADLRILVSSIQVLTDAHDFESWENFPLERQKLFRALAAREDSGLVMLSGDRHSGAIYNEAPAGLGESVWELTSSSLNLAFVSDDADEREPDPKRVSSMITQENFGMVEIDWAAMMVNLRLLDDRGGEIVSRKVRF